MKCECGNYSTILVENEDGTVTPKCESCYYNPSFKKTDCEICGCPLSSNGICKSCYGKAVL